MIINAESLAEDVSQVASVAQTPAWGFELAEPLAVSIRAQSDSGDPVIRLRNGDGVVLAENDDADGTNSLIDQSSALEAGNYCIEMEDLDGNNNAIRVTLSLFDSAKNRMRGINAAELSPLPDDEVPVLELGSLGASAVTDVSVTGDATWLRFEFPEAGVLAIEALGVGIDPAIVLFDRVGRVVGENDDGPNDLNSLLVQRLPAGSYQLAVRLADGDSAAGNVRVFMERFVPVK